MLPIFINILLVVNVIACILLILLTLMQRPKNEGLGAAFGGGMTENLFGAQTTNVLAKATRVLGGMFLGISLILSILYSYEANSPSAVQARLAAKPVPVAPAKPDQAKEEEAKKTVTDALNRALEKAKQESAAASPTPAAPTTPAAPSTPAPAATAAPASAPSATPAQ